MRIIEKKITSISVTTEDSLDIIYAVCDDGTLWKRAEVKDAEQRRWEMVPGIPGDPFEDVHQ